MIGIEKDTETGKWLARYPEVLVSGSTVREVAQRMAQTLQSSSEYIFLAIASGEFELKCQQAVGGKICGKVGCTYTELIGLVCDECMSRLGPRISAE